jgi:glyoxylase-like metal-dependent hydrolase (beta-lactamase superfamily II)
MDIIPVKLSVTNCFLLKAGEKYVLIDTGYKEDWNLFCKRLKEAKIELSQISHIVLTHHHDDHCGLLRPILRENSSIRVVLSRPCGELILKGENDRTHGGEYVNRRIAFLMRYKQLYVSLILGKKMKKEENLRFEPYKVRDCDILVGGNTRLRDIGIPLDGTILETPGHTVDSVTVLLDGGACFPGDAAANMLSFAGTKNCVVFICDKNEYYKSWEKIISAGARQIFPAHGSPFPADRLIRNIWKN